MVPLVRRGVPLAHGLLVIAQADDREQVCVAQLLGPLLETLAAPLRITQLLRHRLLGHPRFLLLLLQLPDLIQHVLPEVDYVSGASRSGGGLGSTGGRLGGGAGGTFYVLGGLRAQGSRRPTGCLWSGGGGGGIALPALSVCEVW